MSLQFDQLNNQLKTNDSTNANASMVLTPAGTGSVLLNGSGQNFLPYSQDYTNASWTKQRTTVTADSTTAPDGTTTADTMTGDGTSGGSMSVYKTTTGLTSGNYVISIYAKASTATWLVIQGYDGSTTVRAWFDLTNGVVGIVESGMSGGAIQSVGNGWYRCSVIRTTGSSSTSLRSQYGLGASNGVEATSATTALILWGAQTEIGNALNTYVPTTTAAIYNAPVLSLSGVANIGLQSDGALYVQPAGTGAIQAQATTSSATGGNARGANAVDWQTSRDTATRVASGQNAFIGAGYGNTNSGAYGFVGSGYQNVNSSYGGAIAGGFVNATSNLYSFAGGGYSNTASGDRAVAVGGQANTSAGVLNFIGGGFTNSGTALAAVTTQSATMNGTTAVTLSGSNASIKIGQYISGTSIGLDTYVAAISGTSLTLSKVASGSSTSTLSFYTPHGIVVGGGNNTATGSYSFIGGGGDAGTAANRNVASGDWSFVGGGRANTSSGNWSTTGGGSGNVNAGSYATIGGGSANSNYAGYTTIGGGLVNGTTGFASSVLGGYGNTATGTYSSVVSGIFGTARSITSSTVVASSSTIIGSVGISQAALLVLAVQTTDATATVLCSDGNAASGTNQVIMPNNSAYYFTGEVVSGVTGGGNTKGWTISGVIKRGANAAATTLVGSTVTSLYGDAGATTWTIGLTADTTNGGLAVTFTGQAATTIRTVAQIRTTEMTY